MYSRGIKVHPNGMLIHEVVTMSDSISKRFIQDALIEKISNLNAKGETQTARELIRLKKFVDGLTPYADRPTGEWVVMNGEVVCSECYEQNKETNYCPHCGAKMFKGGDEHD